MAKTETNVSTLKINRGTYAKVQENLSSITENELIITSDKNVPIPTTNDNGKAVVVNASGEYELGNAGMSQSDADARYLQLSGGTMTGSITYDDSSYKVILTNGTNKDIISANANNINIGNINKALNLRSTNSNLTLSRGSSITSTVLDTTNFEKTTGFGSEPTSVMLTKIRIPDGNNALSFGAGSIYLYTTAPTADNTDGGIRIVKLTSEPAQRYNGWWYIITSSSSQN